MSELLTKAESNLAKTVAFIMKFVVGDHNARGCTLYQNIEVLALLVSYDRAKYIYILNLACRIH